MVRQERHLSTVRVSNCVPTVVLVGFLFVTSFLLQPLQTMGFQKWKNDEKVQQQQSLKQQQQQQQQQQLLQPPLYGTIRKNNNKIDTVQQQQQQQQGQRREYEEDLLGLCEGYCKDDKDCRDGLVCHSEEVIVVVPGCTDSDLRSNFCYDPKYYYESSTSNTNNSTNSSSSYTESSEGTIVVPTLDGNAWVPREKYEYPLQKCQGHCSDDKDCVDGLTCYVRLATSTTTTTTTTTTTSGTSGSSQYIPGCLGLADPFGTSYCYDALDTRIFSPAPTGAPVTASPVTAAPVTSAPVTSAPVTSAPVIVATTSPITPGPTVVATIPLKQLSDPGNDGFPIEYYPLQRCEGDCDGDSECADGLVCYYRDGFDPVPGCGGLGLENGDYCIDKKDDPAIPPVLGAFRMKMYWEYGFDWQEEVRERNWCFQCLKPYCYGTIITLTDDCLDTTCQLNDIITINTCGTKNIWFEMTNAINNTEVSLSHLAASYELVKQNRYEPFVQSYQRQIASAYYQFTRAQYEYYGSGLVSPTNRTYFVVPNELQKGADEAFHEIIAKEYEPYLSRIYNNTNQIVHFKIANTGYCLELIGSGYRKLTVQLCDYENKAQKFKPGFGNFFGATFELETSSITDGCITNQHHPRDYEMMYRATCYDARRYNTSLYNKY